MGVTDVLPYPRRRSSVQLKPINIRLTGEVEEPYKVEKSHVSQLNRSLMADNPQSTIEPKTPPVLSPLRVLPRGMFIKDPKRAQSSKCLFRTRSHSLHRVDRAHRGDSRRPSMGNDRPHEARPRLASDNSENTAQYIERLRRELSSQIRQPLEFNYRF